VLGVLRCTVPLLGVLRCTVLVLGVLRCTLHSADAHELWGSFCACAVTRGIGLKRGAHEARSAAATLAQIGAGLARAPRAYLVG